MTGRGHRWTGVGAAFIAAAIARLADMPEIVAAAVAAASCTLPDWAEMPIYKKGVRSGSLITHRTLTHWPPLWIAVLTWGVVTGGLGGGLLVGTAVGAMTHILGDAPNPMGIPWIVPHQRIKIGKKGLWRSGEHEPLMALTYATLGFVFWRVTGGGLPGGEVLLNPQLLLVKPI